jgi:hypothetical protein
VYFNDPLHVTCFVCDNTRGTRSQEEVDGVLFDVSPVLSDSDSSHSSSSISEDGEPLVRRLLHEEVSVLPRLQTDEWWACQSCLNVNDPSHATCYECDYPRDKRSQDKEEVEMVSFVVVGCYFHLFTQINFLCSSSASNKNKKEILVRFMDSLSNEVRLDVQRVLRIKSSIIASTDVLLGVQDLVGGGKS